MPSIKEVAEQAKVSLSTVSKVLNARNDATIPHATRERVRAAAAQIGYHPNVIAQGLAGKRMNTVGIVMAYSEESVTSDPYLGPCLDGILSVCKQRHQKATLYLEGQWEEAISRVPVYCDGHCDGLLVIIPRMDGGIVERLRDRRTPIPFVIVGDSRDDSAVVAVDVDNVNGARIVTEHLISLGHRRIAVFCGNHDFCSNGQRIRGYRDALEAAGIAFDPGLLFPGDYHIEGGERNVPILRERFPGDSLPTALFCLCDAVAVGAMRALKREGIRVPEDISVVGFDDIAAAETLGLTTMRHPIRQVGQKATEALLGYIDRDLGMGAREILMPELVVRTSTAPPPG